MGDDGYVRRRTSFEKDLREFVLKVIIGSGIGLALWYFSGWTGTVWVPIGAGIAVMFLLAHVIRGDGRDSD